MSETMHNSTVCVQPPVTTNIQLTQFVGLIKGSKPRSPKIQIGQVHSLSDNGNVSLLWYKAPKNLKLALNGEQWIKDVNCLVPNGSMMPFRNKLGLYHLNTGNGFQSIHKSFTSQ